MAELIPVESTIHLPGLPVGREAMVDPEVPYIASALQAGFLIRLDGKGEPIKPPPDEDVDPLPDEAAVEGATDHEETQAVVPPDVIDAPGEPE